MDIILQQDKIQERDEENVQTTSDNQQLYRRREGASPTSVMPDITIKNAINNIKMTIPSAEKVRLKKHMIRSRSDQSFLDIPSIYSRTKQPTVMKTSSSHMILETILRNKPNDTLHLENLNETTQMSTNFENTQNTTNSDIEDIAGINQIN